MHVNTWTLPRLQLELCSSHCLTLPAAGDEVISHSGTSHPDLFEADSSEEGQGKSRKSSTEGGWKHAAWFSAFVYLLQPWSPTVSLSSIFKCTGATLLLACWGGSIGGGGVTSWTMMKASVACDVCVRVCGQNMNGWINSVKWAQFSAWWRCGCSVITGLCCSIDLEGYRQAPFPHKGR